MNINYTPNNTIIFTLARMNPPTPGHLYLIRRLIQTAIDKNVNDVYIILSKSNDDDENPIPCSEKINVLGNLDDISKTMINSEKKRMIDDAIDTRLKTKIENIQVHTICVPDRKGATPFTPLYDILAYKKDIPDLNLFLIIGDDRKNMLDSITDFFFKKWVNVHSVDGIILPREEMTQYKTLSKDPNKLDKLNIAEVPINAMSASFVRNIVKNHRRDKFHELYAPFLEESKIPGLYEMILDGLEKLPTNNKPESPSRPIKYNYPLIKGISSLTMDDSNTNPPKPNRQKKQPATYGGKKTRKHKKYKKNRKTKKNKNSYTRRK